MTTWPQGGDELAVPGMANKHEDFLTWLGPGGYFDECMTGFEYQVAAHMIYEGEPGSELVTHGLAIARAIHDRYAPAKRNPFNEIECGDHYSRAMAAYGVFLAACGYEYHGPQGPPRLRTAHPPRELQGRLHRGGRLGHFLTTGGERQAVGGNRTEIRQTATADAFVRHGGQPAADEMHADPRRQTHIIEDSINGAQSRNQFRRRGGENRRKIAVGADVIPSLTVNAPII